MALSRAEKWWLGHDLQLREAEGRSYGAEGKTTTAEGIAEEERAYQRRILSLTHDAYEQVMRAGRSHKEQAALAGKERTECEDSGYTRHEAQDREARRRAMRVVRVRVGHEAQERAELGAHKRAERKARERPEWEDQELAERLRQEREAEARRVAEERLHDEGSVFGERLRSEMHQFAELNRLVEAHRLAVERQRIAQEHRAAEEYRRAEGLRLAEERRREEKRLAEERQRAEEYRVAEERRLAKERRRAEKCRLARERRREEERARRAVQAKEDASKTIQRAIFGTIVTFGAGLVISRLITGFECRSVYVRNLPANALDHEISTLFTQQGIDPSRFVLASMRPTSDGGKDATVFTDAEAGHVLSVGRSQLEFRGRLLAFEVGTYSTPGKMDQLPAHDLNVLTISWYAPSACYTAIYASFEAAEAKIRELDGFTHFGRKLKVERNTALYGLSTIKISNLPFSAAVIDILALADAQSIYFLPPTSTFLDIVHASYTVRNMLIALVGQISLLSFEPSADTGRDGYVASYCARFASRKDAKRAHDYLEAIELPHLWSLQLQLPPPFIFGITIPNKQLYAQHDLWNELVTSSRINDRCSLTITADSDRPVVHVRLSGSNKATVGAMKVRVEGLATGMRVNGWHASLASQNDAFALSLFELTGAYVHVDKIQRQISVYGSQQAMDSARTRIAEELARLASIEQTITLPQDAARFFVEQGLAELRELLGEDDVKFDSATCMLTIPNSEEAHHAVSHLPEQAARTRILLPNAAADQASCPICFDDVAIPIQLGCEHIYCTSCLRRYLTSSADGDNFPVVCIGDEGRCKMPIPIPTFERFLLPHAFTRLLEAAFSDYIAKHLQDLRFCKTADCTQIYRTTTLPSELRCPTCLSVVCAACQEDGHGGITCAEASQYRNPAEQERMFEGWIQRQGESVKKCPQCNRLMEKVGGCNHITCACGAHICWRCLDAFASAVAYYRHMKSAHGVA